MKTLAELTEKFSDQFANYGLSQPEVRNLINLFYTEDTEAIVEDLLIRGPLLELIYSITIPPSVWQGEYIRKSPPKPCTQISTWIAFSGNAYAIDTTLTVTKFENEMDHGQVITTLQAIALSGKIKLLVSLLNEKNIGSKLTIENIFFFAILLALSGKIEAYEEYQKYLHNRYYTVFYQHSKIVHYDMTLPQWLARAGKIDALLEILDQQPELVSIANKQGVKVVHTVAKFASIAEFRRFAVLYPEQLDEHDSNYNGLKFYLDRKVSDVESFKQELMIAAIPTFKNRLRDPSQKNYHFAFYKLISLANKQNTDAIAVLKEACNKHCLRIMGRITRGEIESTDNDCRILYEYETSNLNYLKSIVQDHWWRISAAFIEDETWLNRYKECSPILGFQYAKFRLEKLKKTITPANRFTYAISFVADAIIKEASKLAEKIPEAHLLEIESRRLIVADEIKTCQICHIAAVKGCSVDDVVRQLKSIYQDTKNVEVKVFASIVLSQVLKDPQQLDVILDAHRTEFKNFVIKMEKVASGRLLLLQYCLVKLRENKSDANQFSDLLKTTILENSSRNMNLAAALKLLNESYSYLLVSPAALDFASHAIAIASDLTTPVALRVAYLEIALQLPLNPFDKSDIQSLQEDILPADRIFSPEDKLEIERLVPVRMEPVRLPTATSSQSSQSKLDALEGDAVSTEITKTDLATLQKYIHAQVMLLRNAVSLELTIAYLQLIQNRIKCREWSVEELKLSNQIARARSDDEITLLVNQDTPWKLLNKSYANPVEVKAHFFNMIKEGMEELEQVHVHVKSARPQ